MDDEKFFNEEIMPILWPVVSAMTQEEVYASLANMLGITMEEFAERLAKSCC